MRRALTRLEERVLELLKSTQPDTPRQYDMCESLGVARSNLISALAGLKSLGLIRAEDKGNGTYGGRRWLVVGAIENEDHSA